MSVKTTQRTALTDREAQIFSLIGHGKSSKEIAADLAISAATVATHRKHICAKLGLHSTSNWLRERWVTLSRVLRKLSQATILWRERRVF